MITIITRLILILSMHATIDARQVTTVSWTQPRAAYLCIYDRVLLFCGDYAAGAHAVQLGLCGPCVAHVAAGDTLTLREVGGDAQATQVERGKVRLAVMRR